MSPQSDDPSPDTTNLISGVVSGIAVQAGSIGRVHVHQSARPVVGLPYRTGTVPPRAASFQARMTTEQLVAVLGRGRAAVLTSDSPTHAGMVSGLGGVGKTQIAVDYAERVWSGGEVDLLVWVTAASREAIVSSYTDVAADLTGIADVHPERGARRLLAWLASAPQRWLVVLDDVQNPGDLRDLWPPATPTGRVVVTTRRRDAALHGHGRTLIDVEVFTPGEADAYLNAALARQPYLGDGAGQLAAELGYLPLALAQATAYLLDRGLTCAEYLGRWRDRQRTLATLLPDPETEPLPDDHRATVAVTWSLSVEQANRLPPAGVAAPVLEVASFLDPNGIPAEVFRTRAVADLVATAVGHEVDAEEIGDALGCLRRLSLLSLNPDVPVRAVRVHALVQRATRESVSAERVPMVVRAAGDALVHVWPEAGTVLGLALRANAVALTEAGREQLWVPDIHNVLFRHGNSLGSAGLVAEAQDFFQRLYTVANDQFPTDDPDILTTRHNLAYWRGHAGDVVGAVAAFGDLLADRLRVLGPDHPDTLSSRHNLAYWRGEAGDAAGTVAAYEALLADYRRVLGPDHPDTLATRQNLASWRGDAGDVAGAVAAYEALLADRLRVLGPDHPETLATRSNLAHWRGHAGDVVGAVAACEALLAEDLRVLGPDHPETLAARQNLARWRGEAGDAAGVVAAFEDLLADYLRVLGPDHPDTLTTRQNLARWRG